MTNDNFTHELTFADIAGMYVPVFTGQEDYATIR